MSTVLRHNSPKLEQIVYKEGCPFVCAYVYVGMCNISLYRPIINRYLPQSLFTLFYFGFEIIITASLPLFLPLEPS